MPNTAPAYTIGGITRPELFFDANGNIILTPAAEQFAETYELKLLYIGLPANTPYPPVAESLQMPVDTSAGPANVAEGAAVNTATNLTVSSTSNNGSPVTYSLVSDTSGGGFQINSTTGVVTVADPTKIDYETSGHAYTVTVQASDGTSTSSSAFTIGVTDPPPSAPADTNAAANTVAEGAAVNTLVGITAKALTPVTDPAATYSLVGDSSGGGFKIDPVTGVVSVADPTKIDYETAPGHAYSITVQASDGVLTSVSTFTIAVTDPPLPPPADTNAAANSVAEGAAVNTLVGLTASAATPATDPAPTYSLIGDTSGGGFKIDPNTGVVSVADPTKIDYETAAGHAYNVTVQATDGVTTSTSTFTIAVTDPPPSAPVDNNAAANTVAEGAAANTLVGITASSTSATNDPAPTYSLTGDTSGGGFQINSTTGVVSVADPTKIDYEAPGHAYSITVQANDGTQTNSQVFTIGVTDVAPSAPTDADGTANSVAEGAAVNTLVGITASSTTSITDPAATYSLTADSSGGGFKIDPHTGVVSVADPTKLDYETAAGHAYSITVQASDGTLTNSSSFTIAVTDPPLPAPVDSNATANSVAEGAAVNTLVGLTAFASTAATDPAATYSLTADSSNGGFQINSTTGVVSVADPTKLDYETAPGHDYTVTVQASDGVTTSSSNFTIAITDPPPSAPTDTDPTANSVVEGAAANTLVGITASSTSATNDPAATYSLTADSSNGGFKINSTTGVVSVNDATKIDYDTAPGHAYSITVQANDGTQTNSQVFAIGVTDVAPTAPVDSDGTTNSVAEGAAVNTLVGITAASTTSTNDPPATYSLTADSSNGGFKIDPNTGVVSVADPTKIDYETAAGHAYSVTVQASDGTLTNSSSFTIAVTDPPVPAPVDSNATANSVAEGAAVNTLVGLTAFAATPVTDPAATYSLTADSSNGGFQINSTTGVVSVADPTKLDYETAVGHDYTVTVQASDGVSTASSNFTIAITDPPPSTPTDTDATANSVAEGAAVNTLVGITASSTDATNDPAATYSLTGDTSGGGFQINSTTGVVSVADPTKIDYETPGHSYNITVQASDGTQTNSQVFTIAVTDVAPSAPTDADGTANSVAEGAAVNTLVGITAASTTSVTDPAATYSLTADSSGGGFKIDPNTGVVSVADPTKLDYETAAGHAYSITVQASDGTLTNSSSFTIAVTDPPVPAPVDSNATANSVAEGAAVNTLVGLTAFAATPVTDPAATYSLTGDTSGGGFQINSTTGVVSVADPTKLDYETAPGHDYTVTVQASDGVSTASSNFTIAITDPPPSAPVDANGATNTVAEAAAVNTLVGITASSTDATNDPAATYSLTGDTSGGGFQINSTTGVVSVADPTKIDYESSGAGHSYTITVQASDGVATNSSNFSIAVTDVAAVANPDSAVVFESRTTTPSVNLLANDTDVDAPPPPLTAVDDTQPTHGTVTVNSDGTFSYTANAGYLGADSFTYHASNGGALPSNSATVSLDVQPLVWHIDNSHTGDLIQDGSAAHPFQSIAAFNTANAAAGTHPDLVYLSYGTGTYTEANGIHLNNNQSLVGQGSALTYQTSASSPGGVQTITLIAADPAHTPTIVATGGDGVDLAQNNTLTGFKVGNASGDAISDEGGTVGTLNVSNVAINTSGEAVHIANGGTLNVDLSSVTSTGGTNGIALTSTSGTFHVEAGSLTGASGAEVSLSGGSVTFTDDGTVGNTSGSNVSISSMTGGTDSFTGAISGHGIALSNNTGATMSFTGGVAIDTSASNSTGFSATGGGTLTVTGSSNTINSGQGTALDVEHTTIGASNLTFQSISSSGGSATGIILDTTGVSGGLHVTGIGTTAGSGGTIATKTGSDGATATGNGIYLNSTSGVQLADMHLHDFQNYGISGTNVSGFTADHIVVDGSNGTSVSGIGEGDVYFTGLSGSASVTNSTFTGAVYDAFHVFNDSGQTLNRITMTGDTFATQGGVGNQSNSALVFEATGGTFNATIQSSTFNGARNDLFHLNLLGTVSSDLVFGGGTTGLGNTLTNSNLNIASGAGGIDVGGGGTNNNITLTYNIAHNTISGVSGADIAVSKGTGTGASFSGTIDSNTIGTQGVADSGSSAGDGIFVGVDGAGTSTTTITNNQIHGVDEAGIHFLNENGSGKLNATIQTNTIDTLNQNDALAGMYLQTGANGSNDNNISNLTIGGAGSLQNSIDIGANNNFAVIADIVLLQNGSTKVGLPGYPGTPNDTTAVQNFVTANNHFVSTANAQAVDALTHAPGGYFGTAQLLAADGGVASASGTPGETNLTQAELDSVVAAAIADWAAAGASASQLAALHATTFSVANLGGNTIGEETPGHIVIDTDAAGHGWYIDPTPSDNSEFTNAQNAAGTDLLTDPSNAAAGHMDLLTAVAHELGHVLGLPDTTAAADVNDLMYISLVDGERKLPGTVDVAQANADTATYPSLAQASEGALPAVAQAPAGTPIVVGTAGNDTIDAGSGGYILFGGAGADHFVFGPSIQLNAPTAAAAQPIAHVADYSAAQGDTFDFSALTSAFHTSNIADPSLVRAVEDPSGTFATLQLNTNGDAPAAVSRGATQPSAVANWVNVAQIDGAHAGDAVNVLVDSHAAIHLAQIHATLLV